MKKTPFILLVISFIMIFAPLSFAASWSDLKEGEREIFGSEKERKYPINAFFVEYERWENHRSFHFLWFLQSTDYPRYSSFHLLPFYYHLESKIDRREKKFAWPVLPYYRVRDLDHEYKTIFPLYASTTRPQSIDWNILYLVYGGKERKAERKESYFGILPVFYYQKMRDTGNDSKGMALITPVFFRYHKEKAGPTPEYQQTNFSPLHFYHRNRDGDRRTRTWGAPLLPLVYYHSSDTERHFNLGWLLFDAAWDRESGRVRRSFLTPLWFYWNRHISDTNNSTLLTTPFNVYRHHIGPREDGSGDDNSPAEWTRWWMPVFPLYYRYTSTETGSHTNFLWFLDWERDTSHNLRRLWIAPIAFYQPGDYFHFLAPVGLMSWRESNNYFRAGIWGVHHSRRSETDPGETEMRRWWAPVIPLVYSSSTATERHVNILGPLFDINWENNRLQRFFTLPLWFFQRDRFSDTDYHTTTASLLHFYSHYHGPADESGAASPAVDSTRWWAPIVPLVYHSSHTDEGTHTNFLWLFDWAHNADGSYRRFWFLPFVYHKSNSYFHIAPPLLYMSWRDGSDNFRTGPWGFSYSSASDNSSVFWFPIVPLYFHSDSPGRGSYNNLAWLFGWSYGPDGNFSHWRFFPLGYWKSGEGGRRYLFPLYIRPGGWTERDGYSLGLLHYHRWEAGETRVRHFFPLYWSWNDLTIFGQERTSGNIALPLWISYKDDTFELDIYLWGGSKSVSMGPLAPALALGLGTREDKWYVDTEWSWFYNAFSVSTRTTISNPFANKKAPAPVIQQVKDISVADNGQPKDDAPHMNRRREVSRENSLNFWGFKVLFGWLCYERADTMRHFRLFPLTWYTWDQASDNKVFNMLIYFYSKSGDQSYHVLFPLYGLSRNGDSYFNAYLLNGYWSEYDAETRRREVTALWPFFNRYWTSGTREDGTAESGWRFFPLIWHKYNRYADGYERSRTLSPLYYGYETSIPGGTRQRMMISPLFYRWKEHRESSGYSAESGTFFLPIIPLFYRSTESRSISAREGNPAENFTISTNFLIPFYYYNTLEESRKNRRESTFVIPILLFYNTSSSFMSRDETGAIREREGGMTFFPGFLRNVEGPESHYNIALLFDTGFNERDNSGYHMLIPLWYYSWDRPSPGSSDETVRSFMFPLLPILCMYEGSPRNGYLFFPFILTYWGWDNRESTFVLGGLWWRNSNPERAESYQHLLPFFMSWARTSYSNPGETDRTIMVPFIPLLAFYDGTASDGFVFSPLTLSYHGWDSDERTTVLLGLFWNHSNPRSRESYFHILPLFMHWENERLQRNTYFFLGLFWHSRPEYRRLNYLLLFDYERWDASDTTEIDLLLGIMSTRRTRYTREFEIALGLIASYQNRFNSPDWHMRLLWLGYDHSGNRRTANFMPLFYSRTIEGGRSYDLYRFPLSFWHYETNGRDVFHTVGFGLAYYRNYYADRNEDRAMVLGGTLFNYVEKPQRGYESWGSFWGILWEYEHEEEGAYNKFSLLKFIFKRVDDHGSVSYRVMGVGF